MITTPGRLLSAFFIGKNRRKMDENRCFLSNLKQKKGILAVAKNALVYQYKTIYVKIGVAEQIPLKEGLKQCFHCGEKGDLFVAEQIPLKEGLKHAWLSTLTRNRACCRADSIKRRIETSKASRIVSFKSSLQSRFH